MADPYNSLQEEPLSVSSAMALAKRALESLTVRLIGEVSEVNNKAGYKAVYFTVKDTGASLPCMMWLDRYRTTGIDLRVGMLVELTGRFSLYAPKGRMNFDVFGISLAGEGNLRLQVANLAKKLEAEGLMRADRKRPIPRFASTVGLVTSPRGDAVHDVLRTLRRRFPLARVVVAGVPVEGENAAAGMIRALQVVQDAGVEVALLVRGGGSFEDLMPFNDEALARAIAAMRIPVVTGIGHEPDTSIADMVSDLRASTPSTAAEAVSPAPEVLEGMFASRASSLKSALSRKLERYDMRIDTIANRPLFKDPNMLYATEAQTLDLAEMRLTRAIPMNLERDRARLSRSADKLASCGTALLPRFENTLSLAASRLHDLSPLTVLARGYAMARTEDGAIVKQVGQVQVGDPVRVELSDGSLACRIEGIDLEEKSLIPLEDY